MYIYQEKVEEEHNPLVESRLAALDRLAEMGWGLVPIDPKYMDDRETYYDDNHRAGLG